MSKAGLWPREKPRPTESNAEIRLYEAFASDLPSNWTVWHSLRIRTDEGMEGEGDFVIAIPDRGFLVLEVKGGYISVRDGRWFQNSKPLDHSPREQAHSFAKKLVSRLPSVNGMTVPYGILTIFPDTPSSDAPVQDNLRDLVLTEVDVRYLKDAITAKLAKDAKVWIFHDPAQAFWEERRLPVWVGDLSNYRLNKCYRCPEPIMEYSKAPMPFIVDDILVNFDDDRSIATLKSLADLAEKTQVILFTHHCQIKDAAMDMNLTDRVFVHQL
jgi:hypothetical protein